MPNVALIPERRTEIPELLAVVDGYPDLTHRLEARTSGAPLEDGKSITDNAVAQGEKLTLNGWVSSLTDANKEKPAKAWERIRELHKNVEPLTVLTPWGTYENMLLVRVTSGHSGLGMRFTAELEQVLIVGLLRTDIEADMVSGPASNRTSIVERGRVSAVKQFEQGQADVADTVRKIEQDANRMSKLDPYSVAEIPITQTDAQSALVRLADKNVNLAVKYQPSDQGWYADIDIPKGTPVVSGRRIVENSPILPLSQQILPGNIWCVSTNTLSSSLGRNPWSDRTHRLMYAVIEGDLDVIAREGLDATALQTVR